MTFVYNVGLRLLCLAAVAVGCVIGYASAMIREVLYPSTPNVIVRYCYPNSTDPHCVKLRAERLARKPASVAAQAE